MENNLIISKKITHLCKKIDGTVGVHAVSTIRGELISLNSEEVFPLGSTYKIPIAMACLKKIEKGIFNLKDQIEIQETDIPESSAILDYKHFSYPGVSLSLENIFRLMMEYSDNASSDIILKHAGGPLEVMNFLEKMGYSKIKINRSISQIFKDYAQSKKDNKKFLTEEKDAAPLEEMTKLLFQFLKGEILDHDTSQFLLKCMYRCKTGNNRIRALLPSKTPVADKTGTANGFVNNIGIISLPKSLEKIILAVYIKNTSATQKESEKIIAKIASYIYEYAISK